MEKKDKKKLDAGNLVWKIVGAVLVVAELVVSVMLILSLINMNIVAGWVIALVVIIMVAILAFSVFAFFVYKKSGIATKIVALVLGLVCIIGGAFALRYTDAFNNFLSKITSERPEMKEYSVLVTKDSSAKEIEDLKQKSVGFLETDQMASVAEQYLQKQVSVESYYYEDVDMLTDVLLNGIVDAIALETDRVEMIKEEMSDFEDQTRVIYTFEIELDKKGASVSKKEVTTEPFIIYISGSDSRTGIKTTARSDVNIVAVVNPKKGKILLASIPRDTYVQLHDTTGLKDKLTHAGIYGIEMSKNTIEDFLGIDVDYTLKVSFDTVVKVVDELDGIDIESDQELEIKTKGKVCKFEVGVQHVDGDCALRFARERKSYETGDRHRGENQQQVITKIIERLSGSKNYLMKVPAILDVASDSFETSLSRAQIASFIRMQLANSIDWKVESIAVDGTGTMEPTYSMGASRPLYVMIPSDASVENVTTKINQYLED